MIKDTYQEIVDEKDLRQNLSKLKKELKEGGNKHALLYYLAGNYEVFFELLSNEDAKVRKNVALVMGELGVDIFLEPIYEAYENETKLFVRSSYLTALRELDYRKYLPQLKHKLEELNAQEIPEESKKHRAEEMRMLSNLVVTMEGVKTHEFIGYHEPSNLVLLTNRNHIHVTMEELKTMHAKSFNAGVMVKTNQLEDVLAIRTYQELLFRVEGMKVCEYDPLQAAKTLVSSELLPFLKQRHKGNTPFYFRIELKSKMEMDKRSDFTKKLASEMERLSNRALINSTSNYEVELRLIENKEKKFNILVKLYTLKNPRFSYRREVIPTSIRVMNAALTVALTKEYMKEDAQVLDPFCGVGTMLIERHKVVKANTMYGVDVSGEAIKKARTNTEQAKQIIHYVNRDFKSFRHEYLFDEIITNLPAAIGHKKETEIYELYQMFFEQAKEHLKKDGIMILYSHNREYVKRLANYHRFRIVKEYEISMKEGTYVIVLRYS